MQPDAGSVCPASQTAPEGGGSPVQVFVAGAEHTRSPPWGVKQALNWSSPLRVPVYVKVTWPLAPVRQLAGLQVPARIAPGLAPSMLKKKMTSTFGLGFPWLVTVAVSVWRVPTGFVACWGASAMPVLATWDGVEPGEGTRVDARYRDVREVEVIKRASRPTGHLRVVLVDVRGRRRRLRPERHHAERSHADHNRESLTHSSFPSVSPHFGPPWCRGLPPGLPMRRGSVPVDSRKAPTRRYILGTYRHRAAHKRVRCGRGRHAPTPLHAERRTPRSFRPGRPHSPLRLVTSASRLERVISVRGATRNLTTPRGHMDNSPTELDLALLGGGMAELIGRLELDLDLGAVGSFLSCFRCLSLALISWSVRWPQAASWSS